MLPLEVTHWNFAEIFGIRRLESWAAIHRCLPECDLTFGHFDRTPTHQLVMDGGTQGHDVYRAGIALHIKTSRFASKVEFI